ncbi:hypothetical protein [Fusobacterium sp.]|uniref:hypothetical protein n=1 Tax=Fusobacterium sp. TaxID=68766 RepID=UPI00261A33EB|nr:hypothetical protein [Fusobacterium sp.]
MNFFEAMIKLKDGYKVRNTKWDKYSYITIGNGSEFIVNEFGATKIIHIEDYRDLLYFIEVYNGDWEIYEEYN